MKRSQSDLFRITYPSLQEHFSGDFPVCFRICKDVFVQQNSHFASSFGAGFATLSISLILVRKKIADQKRCFLCEEVDAYEILDVFFVRWKAWILSKNRKT